MLQIQHKVFTMSVITLTVSGFAKGSSCCGNGCRDGFSNSYVDRLR